MRIRNKLAVLVSASLAAATILPVLPAAAQPLRLAPAAMGAAHPEVTPVRYRGPHPVARPHWRPPHGAWGPGRYRAGWGWYRPGWGWGYYNNSGAWIAAGIAGAALGAAAVGAANAANADADAIAYCSRRFKSYNPRTGTYTGYDGLQHPCP